MSFDRLSRELNGILRELAIHTPTAVQARLIPEILAGSDILAAADTGSGKTLAYLLPLLDMYGRRDAGRARESVLIVVPTRELVRQLARVLRQLLPAVPACRFVEIAGGSSINTQLKQLRGGADFLLATPGRLLDVLNRNGIEPARIRILVLDEADRLLGEGFQEELDELTRRIEPRQTLMFSATYTRRVKAKAGWLLRKPLQLDLTGQGGNIVHRVVRVDQQRRLELLGNWLALHTMLPALVFTADRKTAQQLATALRAAGLAADALHGRLSMAQRSSVLQSLEQGDVQLLVATDLAARGLDIPRLPTVIHYDLPRSVELYTHRSGRTARAGETGQVISLVDINAEAHLRLIEKRLGMDIPREELEDFKPVNVLVRQSPMTDGTGGIKGKRMSKKDKLRLAAARARTDTK